ncbi:PTS sugar transporter subunit IIB [Alkalibacterium iburiense]|uniref:PTS sugar transporter subunit IIB n=1 Tax=Alkalibacterium iburiense TaxID=290589 RepID=A0ABN0X4H9_9LACT
MTSKNVLLICTAGMSSSFLVSKMQETVKMRGLDMKISAVSASEAERKLNTIPVDYLLLSPQVRYLKPSFEKSLENNQPVIYVIDQTDYAMMNTGKIVDDLV